MTVFMTMTFSMTVTFLMILLMTVALLTGASMTFTLSQMRFRMVLRQLNYVGHGRGWDVASKAIEVCIYKKHCGVGWFNIFLDSLHLFNETGVVVIHNVGVFTT